MGGAEAKALLCLHLLHCGVSTAGVKFFIMSTAYTKDDIDRTVKSFGDSLNAMTAGGSLNKTSLEK